MGHKPLSFRRRAYHKWRKESAYSIRSGEICLCRLLSIKNKVSSADAATPNSDSQEDHCMANDK